MSRRALVALVLAGIAAMLPASPSVAAGSVSPVADHTFNSIAGCLATQGDARILLVVDESASLQETDPGSQRSEALAIALQGIADLQKANPGQDIQVAASTFAEAYNERVGWGPAKGSHMAALQDFARNDVPNLNKGQATDYRLALNGARKQLPRSGNACKIAVWFTDGSLQLGPNASTASEARALEEICRSGGIADALRAEGVYLVALALFDPASKYKVTDKDRANLQSIAEGAGPGAKCGKSPIPEKYAGGAYLPADNAVKLAEVFAGTVARVGGYTQQECKAAPTAGNPFVVDVPPGVNRVRVHLFVRSGEPRYQVKSPTGASADVNNSLQKVGAFPVSVNVQRSMTEVDLELPEGQGVGKWTFIPTGGAATCQSWMKPVARLDLEPPGQTVSLEADSPISVRLVGSTGQPLDPSLYGSVALTAKAGSQTLPVTGSSGAWTITVPKPTGSIPRKLRVATSLVVSPKGGGAAFQPVLQNVDLPVSTSAAYPVILSEVLDFGEAKEPAAASATLDVKGSSLGETKVCLAGGALQGPDESIAVAGDGLDSQGCATLAKDEQRSLTLSATPSTITDGVAVGVVSLELRGTNATDKPITQELDASLQLSRPVDRLVQQGLLWLLMLLSAAVPLLLTYVQGRKLARIVVPANCQFARVPATLRYDSTADKYSLTTSGSALYIHPNDVRWLQSRAHPSRENYHCPSGLTFVPEFTFLGRRKILGLNVPALLVEPSASAELHASTGWVIASNQDPYALSPTSAPAKLSVDQTWFLLGSSQTFANVRLTGEDQNLPVELIFYCGERDINAAAQRRVSDTYLRRMVQQLQASAAKLAERSTPAPATVPAAPPPPNPGASGGLPAAAADDDDWL